MIKMICIEQQGKKYLLEMPHIQYYEFAKRNFFKHQNIFQTIEKLRSNNNHLPKDQADNTWFEYHETMLNILLYGALSLEAYMNYYAKRYEIPFSSQLERPLSTHNKWNIYPSLKLQQTVNGHTLKIIGDIFKLRNDFVHAKVEKVLGDPKVPYEGKSAGAQLEKLDKGKLFFDINSVYEAIFSIDKDEAEGHEKHPWLCKIKKREE